MIAKQCKLQSKICVATSNFPDAKFNAIIAHPNANCSNNVEKTASTTIDLWFSKLASAKQADVDSCCGSSFVAKHALMLLNDELRAVGIAATRFKKMTDYEVDFLVIVFSNGVKEGVPVYVAGPKASMCSSVNAKFNNLCDFPQAF